MDLLGGYGSDNSDNSSTSTPVHLHSSSSTDHDEDTVVTAPAPLSVSQPPSSVAAASSSFLGKSSSTTTSKPVETEITTSSKSPSRRCGKRLISLHAVLPTHILEQLTKTAATGGLDSDSDDEDDDVSDVIRRTTQDSKRRQHDATTSTVIIGKDDGLSSFLSELKSTPTSSFLASRSSTGSHTADTKQKPCSSQPMLGQAFTTITHTTTTAVKSRTKNAEIVDIHATTKWPEQSPAASPHVVKPFESEQNSETTTIIQETIPNNNAVAAAASPRTLTCVSVPRPGRMMMNRHPTVVLEPLPATMTEQQQQSTLQSAHYYQQPYNNNNNNSQEDITTDARLSVGLLAKKKSRKEMEKALRAGNLQALDDEEGVSTNIVEAQGSTYVPQEETYRIPHSGTTITKVTPVSMYDPKAGTDVMQQAGGGGITGKQRGKHQIHTLLASAASLELQRARAIGTSGGKGKRADAKRKYGW